MHGTTHNNIVSCHCAIFQHYQAALKQQFPATSLSHCGLSQHHVNHVNTIPQDNSTHRGHTSSQTLAL